MPNWLETALIVVGIAAAVLVLGGFAFQVRDAIRLEYADRRRAQARERRLTLTDREVAQAYIGIAQANPQLRSYGRNLSGLYLIPDRDGAHGWPVNRSYVGRRADR